jgi:hypothetical protein
MNEEPGGRQTIRASAPGDTPDGHESPAAWLAAIASGLTAAGLVAELNESGAGLDVTGTLARAGHKEIDVIVDEDGYAELHWWIEPDASPATVATAVARAIAAITGTEPAEAAR